MEKLQPPESVYVAESRIPHAGRGVFARKAIAASDIIEVCPVIEVPLTDPANNDEKGLLVNYFFYFGDSLAMALGYGSLYNHSYEPNATYIKNPEEGVIKFQALRDIAADDEITVNYNNGDPDDKSQPMNKGIPPVE